MSNPSDGVTRLLEAVRAGEPDVLDRFVTLVDDELRRIAARPRSASGSTTRFSQPRSSTTCTFASPPEVDLLALDPRVARLVEQRYFGGPTIRERAEVMTTSPKTVEHEWEAAKPWLSRALSGGEVA